MLRNAVATLLAFSWGALHPLDVSKFHKKTKEAYFTLCIKLLVDFNS